MAGAVAAVADAGIAAVDVVVAAAVAIAAVAEAKAQQQRDQVLGASAVVARLLRAQGKLEKGPLPDEIEQALLETNH